MATRNRSVFSLQVISRDEAHRRGLKRFYTGEPCKRGHVCERFTSNAGCITCLNRSSPTKHTLRGRNVGWPSVGLIFNIVPPPEPHEIEAAFRMLEAYGWHDHCVKLLRENPELVTRFVLPPSHEDQARVIIEYERQQATLAALRARAAAASPAEGLPDPGLLPGT